MRATQTLTETLVDFIHDTRFGDLPDEAVGATESVLLDTVACTAAGLLTDAGQRLASIKVSAGGAPEATLIGQKTRLPAGSIAYVHSYAANVLDLEEVLHHKTHVGCCTLMPVLAVAEARGSDGMELLTACAIAFDVAARAVVAAPLYDTSEAGDIRRHPLSASAAALGAAAGAAKLLGLDRTQTAHALGLALLSTPVHKPRFTLRMGMSKYCFYSPIGEAGINAALLAEQGFTSDDGILEPENVFWEVFGAKEYDLEVLLGGLGERWYIAETSIKSYPSCRQGHVALDVFRDIVEENDLKADSIERVKVRIPPTDLVRFLCDLDDPQNTIESQFSVPYAMGMIAQRIEPKLWHSPEHLTPDAPWRALAERITFETVPEWHSGLIDEIVRYGTYFKLRFEITVDTAAGSFHGWGELPVGDPMVPAKRLDQEAVAAKFSSFTGLALPDEKVEEALEAFWQLRSGAPVSAFMAPLA